MITEHRKGTLFVLAAALLWSTGGVFIKLITFNAFQLAAIRSLFAAAVFLVVFKKSIFVINKLTLLNSVSYSLILILFVWATKTTSAANAIFLQYTAPIYVLFLEPFFNKVKMERINIITIFLCFIGMILFFIDRLNPGNIFGNILALLSGIAFAAFLLGTRKSSPKIQPNAIFYGNLIICLVGIPFFTGDTIFTSSDLLMTAYLGIFQIGIAYVLFSSGIKRILAIEASLISMVEPVLNPVWVFIGYGEAPGIFAITGGILILFTIGIRTYIVEKRRFI